MVLSILSMVTYTYINTRSVYSVRAPSISVLLFLPFVCSFDLSLFLFLSLIKLVSELIYIGDERDFFSMAETIVSSIPALHAFDPRTTTWQSYRDRIGFYFKANRIFEDSDKKALLLWAIGDSTYNLLESLLSPAALTDNHITFERLVTVLDSHYDVRKNIMTSTYDFYSCVQKPGQSFID